MPDWKEPGAYGFTAALDRRGWAWEFLRRNADYRADYTAAKAEFEQLAAKVGSRSKLVAQFRGGLPNPLATAGRRWFIDGAIHDPDLSNPAEFLITVFPCLLDWERRDDYFAPVAVDDDAIRQRDPYAVVVFNLSRPLKSQLAQAARLLAQRQEKVLPTTGRNWKPKEWLRSLRLLDAKVAGATTKAILAGMPEYYQHLPLSLDGKAVAADRLSDHLYVARHLCHCPFVLLV
jgi:hypothetical protein